MNVLLTIVGILWLLFSLWVVKPSNLALVCILVCILQSAVTLLV